MKLTELRKKGKAMYRKIGLLLLILCFFAISAPSSYLKAGQTKNVLVLHSYHKGLGWTDRITQGIGSALHSSDQDIELYFEYMDTKRIHDAQYSQKLYELYRHKFRNRRFDVIISSDDHAFNFLLAHHQELFPDTPIVFCGVNDFKDSMLVGHNLITGVVESFDIKGTIDVALQLHPNAKEVFVIVDKTLSGRIVKEMVTKAIPYFKDVLKFTFLEDLDMSEVLERVKNLPTDSIVFLISLVIDKSGKTFSFQKSCALISQNSSVPIYSHSDAYLGHGLVGGKLNCGDAQGKMAGEMALRILHGEKVKDIPVVKKSPNRYVFDYHQMQRFGIKLSSLPKGSTVINRPYSFYSKHKRLVWSVIASIAGLVLIILILSTNIIKRRRAERTLRESEEKYRSLVESTEDSIYLVDRDGTYLFVNKKHLSRLGSPADKVIGKTYGEFHSLDDTKEFVGKLEEVFETGETIQLEHRSVRDDRYFLRTLSPIKDPDGNTTSVTVVSKDITERKQAEEALQKSEAQKKAILDASIDVIRLVDKDMKVIWANKTTTTELKAAPEQLVGRFCYEAVAGRDIPCSGCPTKKALKSGKTEHALIHHKELKGIKEESYWDDYAVPVKNESGDIINLIQISRNITDRKKAEEEKERLEAQLHRAQKMEAMGLLAGGVAHDLNNILSGIVSYPELLLMDLPEDSPLKKPIKIIQESGMRAADVVEDLLTIARGVATGKEALNLNTIVTEYLESPEYQTLDKTHSFVNLKTELDPDLLNMSGSLTHIKKTLMNLVVNASEAIEGAGTVTISTMNRYLDEPLKGYEDIRTGEYAVLTVSDDGSGITPKDLERIFEPFYTKKVMDRSGTGLGLAVVWNTVQDHKGYINVNTSKKGTVFELYFPVTRDEVTAEKEKTPLEDYLGHGEKILVVDDEERQRMIASGMLTRLGYTAETVSSGEEAIEYMKKNAVDLIVLDMVMPKGINGRETYQQIIKIRPGQKAVIASGYAKTKEVDIAQELGAGKYIMKPYTLEKIGVAVKEALEK